MIIKRNKNKKNIETTQEVKQVTKVEPEIAIPEPEVDIFENIKERQERRRGDRRRGYRRIDDRNLVSRAQEEANAIKERAAKEGFQQGLSLAKQEIGNLNITIEKLLKTEDRAIEKFSDNIAFIAIKAAEKIIHKEVELDKELVINVINDVMKQVGKDDNRIIIKTNPSDTETVREKIPTLLEYTNTRASVSVIEDSSVEWGSCVVETTAGIIDAKFSTQIEILKNAFQANL